MYRPTKDKPSIKFVKKAGLWCKTYFEYNERTHDWVQRQEWTEEKPSESPD